MKENEEIRKVRQIVLIEEIRAYIINTVENIANEMENEGRSSSEKGGNDTNDNS